jgi:photosystem II stability/assembly factor-like uncharacterized protein
LRAIALSSLCLALVAGAATADGATVPRVALTPNAVAFRSPAIGLAGTGWLACADNPAFGCRPQGTISRTADGGRTWTIALRTPRPVVGVSYTGSTAWAHYDDGETLTSTDGGRHWRIAQPLPTIPAPCPPGAVWTSANQVVVTPEGREWALCVNQPGAGNQGKAVYRAESGGWKRVAWTSFPGPGGHDSGGISPYGYPQGLAMDDAGFGLIWESRGTLYVTRDGGSHWTGEPKVAAPEVDFGVSGIAVNGGIGFILLAKGGSTDRRLLATSDAGRTWRVVHRWR